MQSYQDNLENHDLTSDITEAVDFLVGNGKYVVLEQWKQLEEIGDQFEEVLRVKKEKTRVVYDANFSLAEELQAQISAVRAVREKIMVNGRLADTTTTREAKEVISSGSTLLGTLMKYHEKVVNMERLRLLEVSVIEALQEVDETLRDKVMELLEVKLERLT